MLSVQNFYIYNYMEGKTLINAKFTSLDECFNVLKNNNSIPNDSYLAIGVDYISSKGVEQSKDFIKYSDGKVELTEIIDETHITNIPEFCEELSRCIAKFKN